jgi:outer membrane receptor protein involved in Fe transport
VALDRKAISELPHFGDDLYRAINVLPGTSGGDISARFSVRGGLYDETLVTLDDQEVMEPFHLKDFQGVFSILDPEMIGGVELTPGGFTAKYGDRMTGVLDMVTRSPTQTRTGFGISLTTAWAHSAGRFAGGKGSWLASARRGYLDFILKAVGDDDDEGDPPDPKYWDAFGKLGYAPSPSHSLSFAFLLADDDLLFEEDDEDDFADVETGYTSRYVWLGHQGVVGSSSFVNTALYAGDVSTDRDFLIIDDPEDELFYLDHIVDNGFFGLRQEWQHDLSKRHYLRWGFDVRRYDVTYDYELNAEIEDPIDDPRFYPGERLDSFHDAFEGDQYSVFVTDRMRLSDRFTGEVGMRYDRQTLTDDDQVSPRVNLLYKVRSMGALRLGWGHFYQSQRPYELRVQYGETEFLPAQKAEQLTFGYETDLGSNYTLRVDAYLREVSEPHWRWETIFDPFHPVPEVATDLAKITPESVSAHGVEFYLASRRGGSFDWWCSYVYSSVEDEINGVDTPRFVNQPHSVTASASWRPGPKWSFTGVFNYHTGWPATAVSAWLVPDPDGDYRLSYDVGPFYQEFLEDFFRIDLRASRTSKVGRKGQLTFFIDVQNLSNRDNQRGIAIADPDYEYSPSTGLVITFPEEHWLPIIPSFGVSYEF